MGVVLDRLLCFFNQRVLLIKEEDCKHNRKDGEGKALCFHRPRSLVTEGRRAPGCSSAVPVKVLDAEDYDLLVASAREAKEVMAKLNGGGVFMLRKELKQEVARAFVSLRNALGRLVEGS